MLQHRQSLTVELGSLLVCPPTSPPITVCLEPDLYHDAHRTCPAIPSCQEILGRCSSTETASKRGSAVLLLAVTHTTTHQFPPTPCFPDVGSLSDRGEVLNRFALPSVSPQTCLSRITIWACRTTKVVPQAKAPQKEQAEYNGQLTEQERLTTPPGGTRAWLTHPGLALKKEEKEIRAC